MNITLDKSFLDGASVKLVAEIFSTHTVFFSEALFYEMLTTIESSRTRCFSKIPATHNPVTLLPNIGTMVRYELENLKPCNPIEITALKENFIFNSGLADGTYVADRQTEEKLKTWKIEVKRDTADFLERCKVVVEYFPALSGLRGNTLQSEIKAIRRELSSDVNLVRSLYRQIVSEGSLMPVPDANQLDESWIIYRWVQCQIASALRMYSKTQGSLEFTDESPAFTRSEHTMHDIDHTIIGISIGRIATDDNEIAEDVLLFNPTSTVVRKDSQENY